MEFIDFLTPYLDISRAWMLLISCHFIRDNFFNSCNVSGVMDSKTLNLNGSEIRPRYHHSVSYIIHSPSPISEHIFIAKTN